jgi:uncharacterized protein YkwD
MQVVGALLASMAVALGVGVGSPARHAIAASCWELDISLDAEEVAFVQLVNQYRTSNGLNALGISTNLTRTATSHAYDMGTSNYFSHTNLAGHGPQVRANGCGYPYGVGENLAAGTNRDTAREAFDAFRASPSHDANMLRQGYVQIGVGRSYAAGSQYNWYWAVNFGTTHDGTTHGATTSGRSMPADSGILSASLVPGQWNVATVLPGGVWVRDVQAYTVWHPLPNGWWQQWGPDDFIPGGWTVGLLPHGMTLDRGRVPR